MKSLMQIALGDDWDKLPAALQAHYQFGTTTDTGHMDIEYPRLMQPLLNVLRLVGALVNRDGKQVSTVVEKSVAGERQYWHRTIQYEDGKVVYFNSFWVSAGSNQVIEFVNPILGLQMSVRVVDGRLEYCGERFVLKIGAVLIPIPEWLALGHTRIVEEAVDENNFVMDFRITHPWFGQVFRYSGQFEASSASSSE